MSVIAYVRPTSLDDALALKAGGDRLVLAGGTDVLQTNDGPGAQGGDVSCDVVLDRSGSRFRLLTNLGPPLFHPEVIPFAAFRGKTHQLRQFINIHLESLLL